MATQNKEYIYQADVVMWLSSVQWDLSGCAQLLEDILKEEEFAVLFWFLPSLLAEMQF